MSAPSSAAEPPRATAAARAPATSPAPRPAPAAPAAPSEPLEVSRGAREGRTLALSFDCGGHAGPTAAILDALREADVSVTFFLIGQWVEAYPELARAIGERHEVANHSHAHPDYRGLSDEAIARDLERADAAIVAATGRSTRPLWRAPSGARDARVLASAARADWPVHVFWTIERDTLGLVTSDSGDWRGFTASEVAANLERAAALGGGVITVSHCDSDATRDALPEVLRRLRAAGVRVTMVSEVLAAVPSVVPR
ncbi:MAG: polysaccharide deacetylase family protein [Dehalococcoidia bacterium]|nr:polysaccharide deacetylase family protein [Dehalococcoidia bacterium]